MLAALGETREKVEHALHCPAIRRSRGFQDREMFGDSQRWKQPTALRHKRDLASGDLMWLEVGQGLAFPGDRPLTNLREPPAP